MSENWKEKQDTAKALMETVKADMKAVQNAEDVEKLRRQFDEARQMAAEAGRERLDLEKAKLAEVMAEHERMEKSAQEQEASSQSFRLARPKVQPFQLPKDINGATLSERMQSDSVRMLASERFIAAIPDLQTAALAEGTGSQGGYLVVPQYLQDLFAETRRQGNALRSYGWMSVHPVESNQIYIPKGGGSASVQFVGENPSGGKPSADQTYSQISVQIFTAAGISKQSKQLAMDSSPTVLDLSTRELGTLLGNLEEATIIAGQPGGPPAVQPTGILGTAGLAIAPQTSDTTPGAVVAPTGTPPTGGAQNVIDQILNAVVAIETQYFAPPTGVLMHPRRLGYLLKGKDTALNYLFNRQGNFRAPNFDPQMRTVTSTDRQTPPYDLFGLPIGTSTNIPTNLNYGASGGSDQDVIIVGAWNEAHWFQRQDVTLDTSDVAGTSWETNQVWIRAEERFGFTAARYPTAFAVVYGKGLGVTYT